MVDLSGGQAVVRLEHRYVETYSSIVDVETKQSILLRKLELQLDPGVYPNRYRANSNW